MNDEMLGTTRADLKPWIRSQMLATPDYVAVSAMKGMLDDAIWKDDRINVPVLTIIADSPNWPKDAETSYRTIAPDLEFHRVSGVGHFVSMEKPKEFNEMVTHFIDTKQLLTAKPKK